jgi:hypothetical protein
MAVLWEKIQKPTDEIDRRKFRIITIMKHHIKYAPDENIDEAHIIKANVFKKTFRQC